MRVLITGSSGLVGAAVAIELIRAGHDVTCAVRREPRGYSEVQWDPTATELPAKTMKRIDGVHTVIHMAGASIAEERWSYDRKREIACSRVAGTNLLARCLAKLESKPAVMICASSVGIYGNRGDNWVDSQSLPGSGFLADVCTHWEDAAEPARLAGIRVAHMRFGHVLNPMKGALAKMSLPFVLGLGGPIGNGSQYMSWLTTEDAAGAIRHVIDNEVMSGPIDTATPHPVNNLEFTTALAGLYKHKARLRLPKIAARYLFGEMADEVLLAGQRVRPTALLRSGYEFQMPELVLALRTILHKPKRDWFMDPAG